jgi:hypothetical protein
MPSRPSVSEKRDDVNCVQLSEVSECHVRHSTALGQPCQHSLLGRCQRAFGPTAT